MSNINLLLDGTVEFTKKWFEGELEKIFNIKNLEYRKYKKYSFPSDRGYRCELKRKSDVRPPFNDVNIVFLAGGTFRIPFFQKQIKEIFPKAEVIMGGELEIITATGAAIHALQIMSGEVDPYAEVTEQKNDNLSHNSEQSRSDIEPCNQISDEKECESSINSNLGDKGSITHTQMTITISEVDMSNNKHKAIPDSSEKVFARNRSLLP